jgi:3-oxoadipate enol-lactonase
MLEAIPAEGYADCCEAIARWDARSDVSTIRAATLVISGADDVATPVEDGTFLAESIPGAELTVLPECAHLANVEQPTLFARTLLHHLRAPAGTEAT